MPLASPTQDHFGPLQDCFKISLRHLPIKVDRPSILLYITLKIRMHLGLILENGWHF